MVIYLYSVPLPIRGLIDFLTSATYTEHLPMTEPHTAMRIPAWLGKFPYRPPWLGLGAAQKFLPLSYFVSWFQHSEDFNQKSSASRPVL